MSENERKRMRGVSGGGSSISISSTRECSKPQEVRLSEGLAALNLGENYDLF